MTELKRCPFCGYDDVRIVKDMKDTSTPVYAVVCDECGGIFYTGDMLDMQSVIEEWNTRPNPWHTGTPTEVGLYVIAYRFGNKIEHEIREMFYSPDYGMTFGIKKDIVAWQKIEPYEGEVTNG